LLLFAAWFFRFVQRIFVVPFTARAVSVSAVLAAGFGHNSCLSHAGSFLAYASGGIRFSIPLVPATSASAAFNLSALGPTLLRALQGCA
jgi:hypothetical protein